MLKWSEISSWQRLFLEDGREIGELDKEYKKCVGKVSYIFKNKWK